MKPAVALAALAVVIAFGATTSEASAPAPIVFAADRAPTVTGEIWRLDPSGRRVNLTHSPYTDSYPAVSWDGRHVAFLSDRTAGTSLYEVGIGGRGLKRVGPPVLYQHLGGCDPELAWAPNGTLGVLACGNTAASVWLVRPGKKTLRIVKGNTDVFEGFSWSSQSLLALQTPSGTAVYDASGHLRWRKQPAGDSRPVWSPDGGLLAFSTGNSTVVLDANGGQVISKKTRGGLAWVDDDRLAVGGYFGKCVCKAKILDVRTGAVTVTPRRDLFAQHSADGKLVLVTRPEKPGFALGVKNVSDGSTRTYARIPGCFNDGSRIASVTGQQFAGPSIVFQTWGYCDPPFANLYSVGTGIHRLTNVEAEETQPELSPDGTEIVYVWASGTGLSCKGCSDGIRIASVTGDPIRTLTNPENCTFDESPTWSPDGATILYAENTCSVADELFTIPSAGGTPHDLGVAGGEPAWGPARIAYVASGIWTANPDGSDPIHVSAHGDSPAWSPSGQLAYLVGKSIVIGPKIIQLPFQQVGSLRWTPDGTRLLVTANPQTYRGYDLYSIKPDGTDLARLTKNFGVTR
jgi:Tol biopolymer transport system component